MKLTNKISWLMGRVQKSLFPHLDECFDTPPTEQEKRLVSISTSLSCGFSRFLVIATNSLILFHYLSVELSLVIILIVGHISMTFFELKSYS